MDWLTSFIQDLQLSGPALWHGLSITLKSGYFCHDWWSFDWHTVSFNALIFH